MLVGVFILVATGGLFWLAYRRPRPRRWLIPRRQPVPVRATPEPTAQSAPEPDLHHGPDFAARVRSLAALGTPAAIAALEAELGRATSAEPDEQACCWADVATELRKLNHAGALPAVLRCADAAAGLRQGILLSAEAVGFANFPTLLHALAAPDGRLAVRALACATRGVRDGTVDLAALVRAGLGDHLAVVAETAPAAPDPWLTAAMLEAERVARRGEHWARFLPADVRPLAERQTARLAASATRRRGWLSGAASRLIARFPTAPADEQVATLRVLDELRADTSTLFPALPDRRAVWWADAVRGLTWAKARHLGPLLASQADRLVTARRPGTAPCVVLAALRRFRCREAETVVLKAAGHQDATVRRAATGALGWADPSDTTRVIGTLKAGRADADAGVRQAAVAALARFGELAALREYAQGLIAEDPTVRQATILSAADEGISWLWPDLDLVAEVGDPDTALAAAEALERLREAALGVAD